MRTTLIHPIGFCEYLPKSRQMPGQTTCTFARGRSRRAEPEHANVLAKTGWTRSSIQDRLFELCHVRRSRIRSLNAALTPKGSDDDLIPVFESSDRFLVFVAGADGLYSVVFPSWSAGAHGNNPVHMAVVVIGRARFRSQRVEYRPIRTVRVLHRVRSDQSDDVPDLGVH